MSFREPVNKKCPCGSGKKHKNCCGKKSEGFRRLLTRIRNGEIPLSASIRASEGTTAEMQIIKASVSNGVVEKQLVSSPVSLSVNSVSGEKTENASVSLSVPVRGQPVGVISTSGNATAVTGVSAPSISIGNSRKRVKEEGENGLYVVAYISTQTATGRDFLNILFGTTGQPEHLDDNGTKQRPHISIYPDGAGKFVRVSSHQCQISSQSEYDSGTGSSRISSLKILSHELHEEVELIFKNSGSNVVLDQMQFVQRKT